MVDPWHDEPGSAIRWKMANARADRVEWLRRLEGKTLWCDCRNKKDECYGRMLVDAVEMNVGPGDEPYPEPQPEEAE